MTDTARREKKKYDPVKGHALEIERLKKIYVKLLISSVQDEFYYEARGYLTRLENLKTWDLEAMRAIWNLERFGFFAGIIHPGKGDK